jgi:hypothetical protein
MRGRGYQRSPQLVPCYSCIPRRDHEYELPGESEWLPAPAARDPLFQDTAPFGAAEGGKIAQRGLAPARQLLLLARHFPALEPQRGRGRCLAMRSTCSDPIRISVFSVRGKLGNAGQVEGGIGAAPPALVARGFSAYIFKAYTTRVLRSERERKTCALLTPRTAASTPNHQHAMFWRVRGSCTCHASLQFPPAVLSGSSQSPELRSL